MLLRVYIVWTGRKLLLIVVVHWIHHYGHISSSKIVFHLNLIYYVWILINTEMRCLVLDVVPTFWKLKRLDIKLKFPLFGTVYAPIVYAVDDELHLLLFCKQNKPLRNNFLSSIEHHLPNIAAMHHIDRFSQIMSSSNKFVLRELAKYIYDSFEIRKNATMW